MVIYKGRDISQLVQLMISEYNERYRLERHSMVQMYVKDTLGSENQLFKQPKILQISMQLTNPC